MTNFSANESGLGYLFQARYALWLLLNGKEQQELVLETLDDIVLESSGSAEELLQTKHHLRKPTSLTDGSAELWKTIRIWSTHLSAGKIKIPPTRLTLVTTATAPEGSIAAALRPNLTRDIEAIANALAEIATTSSNTALKSAFNAYIALTQSQREALVSAIDVLDNSADISDTGDKIRERIMLSVDRQFRESLFERVEGWWFGKVVDQLNTQDPVPVTGFEVADQLRYFADQLKPDSLPIDFLEAQPGSVDAQRDDRTFVAQLREIEVGPKRIEKAILDYYRAFEQRSRWAREDLLIGGEIERYERSLIDEWERLAGSVTDELNGDETDEDLKRIGRDIFRWAEQVADVRIRPNVTVPFVMRGSYHMLANEEPPRVWWHPKYLERLQAILTTGAGPA